jgi:CRISPR-associated protein Cas5d
MMRVFCLSVKGNFACFTRPELKVERVSYDLITPSASRAIFEAILWKPAIKWRIHKIEVLNDINWFSIKRHEIGSKIYLSNIQKAMNGNKRILAINIEDDRKQRSSLILRDVEYRIYGSLSLTDKAGVEDNRAKFESMFMRRASKGQTFHQPYLGCREFPCSLKLIEKPEEDKKPINEDRELGWMLYDMDYSQEPPSPLFFKASMQKGVVNLDGVEIRG